MNILSESTMTFFIYSSFIVGGLLAITDLIAKNRR